MSAFYGNITKYLEKAFAHFLFSNSNNNDIPNNFNNEPFSLTADNYRDAAKISMGNKWIQFTSNPGDKTHDAEIIIQHAPPDDIINDDNNIVVNPLLSESINNNTDISEGATITITGLTYDNAGHINNHVDHSFSINIQKEINERTEADNTEAEARTNADSKNFKDLLGKNQDQQLEGENIITLIGEDTDRNKSIRQISNEELTKQLIPENAKEPVNTLAGIATWIQKQPGLNDDLNQLIENETNRSTKLDEQHTAEIAANLEKIDTNTNNIAINLEKINVNTNNITNNSTEIETIKTNYITIVNAEQKNAETLQAAKVYTDNFIPTIHEQYDENSESLVLTFITKQQGE